MNLGLFQNKLALPASKWTDVNISDIVVAISKEAKECGLKLRISYPVTETQLTCSFETDMTYQQALSRVAELWGYVFMYKVDSGAVYVALMERIT